MQAGQAVWEADDIRMLAQHIQASLVPLVEQLLLVDYPLCRPPASDAAEPSAGFKLDEVSVSLKVQDCKQLLLPKYSKLQCTQALMHTFICSLICSGTLAVIF